MAITYEEALGKLRAVKDEITIDELRDLIRDIDFEPSGDPTLLFSGKLNSSTEFATVVDGIEAEQAGLRTLRRTEASNFLSLRDNPDLRDVLLRLFDDEDPSRLGTSSNRFLNGDVDANGRRIPNGIWDMVSRRFVEEASGEVRLLVDINRSDRVFAQTELPALIANTKVTTIEGIPRQQLADLVAGKGAEGLEAARRIVATMSQANIAFSGLALDRVDDYLTDHLGNLPVVQRCGCR